MDRQALDDIMSGSRGGAGAALLRGVLSAASVPYAAAMRLRRWAYRTGVIHSHRTANAAGEPVPVICVGNITTGGTGKTPVVAWLVGHLRQMGRRPAILTRGYKAVAGRSDEAELLQTLCNSAAENATHPSTVAAPHGPSDAPTWRVPVVVNADRVGGARDAVADGADVLVMDDGFQHRRLTRDLDIVLIDATNPLGYGHCLPRGMLREGAWALADAHAIVITHAGAIAQNMLADLRLTMADRSPRAIIVTADHDCSTIIDESGHERPAAALAGMRVLAFCGLGNPAQFFDSVRATGAEMVGARAFADHAAYTRAMLDSLAGEARSAGAQLLLTTQKDHVKLVGLQASRVQNLARERQQRGQEPAHPTLLPIWQLATAIRFVDGQDNLLALVRQAVEPGKR